MTVRILKFFTDFKPDGKGEFIEVDKVAYCQPGQAQRSVTVAAVSKLSRVHPPEAHGDNEATKMAWARWQTIKPAYEAWKSGQEVPIDGTPLGAWSGITQSQAEVMRAQGIRTVEEFAEASDGVVGRIPLPGSRHLQEVARQFLESADRTKVSNDLAQKDVEINELREQLEEMRQIVLESQSPDADADKPKRGRPRKDQAA